MSTDIKIIVATHKKSEMPEDEMYLPLHVGAAGKFNSDGTQLDLGYTRDDTGENISAKNPNFGTQTGLYWAWKNLDAEYKGLVHYRRYFIGDKNDKKDMIGSVMTYEYIKPMLGHYKIFVPKKRYYYIETLYSHYAHTHDEEHFKVVQRIIKKDCPEYLCAYNKVLKRRWGYMFNLMILQKDFMNDYCSWLFNILFQVTEHIDKSDMSSFDSRFCGRISEILFDVWIENKIETGIVSKSEIKELSYIENVNWNYKVRAFLYAKFFHKRYGASS
ncbi:DUF4422 domain-containing protein [Enterocloster aldenensis]|uniref:DUF4422 domain-containing protein n=1 Tax=Enterocloster aldenensis TaxID=358742 RepID=UPI004026F19F